ncbi:MAG: SCO family protein [Ignavibacteria bacterium]|jgi:protein SCO1/2
MNKRNGVIYLIIISCIFCLNINVGAQNKQIKVGIDEKLGDYLPLEAEFQNSKGDTVQLKDIITKPTILALVYYECPGICSPLLTEIAWVINKVDLTPVKDFQVVTLSIDPRETPETTKRWKKNYYDGMKNDFPDEAWHFLTGNEENIKKVADALGYRYQQSDDGNYTHPGAIVAVSPDGKISRYLLGIQFNPFDIKMAVYDAQQGKTVPTVAKVLQFCFSYDPEGRGYTLNITRIIGSVMLLCVGIFLGVLLLIKKKGTKELKN